MYDVANQVIVQAMRRRDTLVIDVVLVPLSDAVDAFAVDVIVLLCHHLSNDGDANADAFDDLPEFVFSLMFLVFDVADICNLDVLSCEALYRKMEKNKKLQKKRKRRGKSNELHVILIEKKIA